MQRVWALDAARKDRDQDDEVHVRKKQEHILPQVAVFVSLDALAEESKNRALLFVLDLLDVAANLHGEDQQRKEGVSLLKCLVMVFEPEVRPELLDHPRVAYDGQIRSVYEQVHPDEQRQLAEGGKEEHI